MIAGKPDNIKSKLVVFRLRIGKNLAGEGNISLPIAWLFSHWQRVNWRCSSRQYHGTLLLRSSAGMNNRTITSAATANRALTMSSTGPQIAPLMADRGPPVLSIPPGVEEDTVGVAVGTAVGVGETAGVGLVEGVGEASVMRIWACARSAPVDASAALTVASDWSRLAGS
jgi:hypothetical protein